MLILDTKKLQNKKNLLAFSAGVDSSALFYLLLENNINFDIAIVDYGLREESKKEINHAKTLAKRHKLFCHDIKAPKYETHFEKKARDFRYEFFESLISIEGYDNLLTAHQLNDQLEWLFMRFTKGAGASELIGLEPLIQKENYILLRPLLSYTKEELLSYLKENDYPYFIDESNDDEKYERNKFRKRFSDALMSEYSEGIKRSFDYLRNDKTILESNFESLYTHKSLQIVKLHNLKMKTKAVDIALKQLGYLLSASQRQEIEKENSLVIGGEWAIEIQDDLLYLCPYVTVGMTKEFKEKCRVYKVPNKIRPYIFKENIEPSFLIPNS